MVFSRRQIMNDRKRCAHCRRMLAPSRKKNQHYCTQTVCQRARKALWQRQKMATDVDYQANQADAYEQWCQQNPDYWQQYRDRHPDYVKRNRQLQTQRNAKRQQIAKMDARKPFLPLNSGIYYILSSPLPKIAKKDLNAQKVHIIPAT